MLHSGNSPKALWGEPLASAGSSPYPQKWNATVALCPVLSNWCGFLYLFVLVDSIKRINSTSLTLYVGQSGSQRFFFEFNNWIPLVCNKAISDLLCLVFACIAFSTYLTSIYSVYNYHLFLIKAFTELCFSFCLTIIHEVFKFMKLLFVLYLSII